MEQIFSWQQDFTVSRDRGHDLFVHLLDAGVTRAFQRPVSPWV